MSDQRLYSGDQLQVGPYLLSFVSERPEDMRLLEKKLATPSKGATWTIWLVGVFLLINMGGYLFYSKTYRPWKARRIISSTSKEIENLLKDNPPIDEARSARELLSQSTLAFSQQLEKQGKPGEVKRFLIAYLKNHGADQEAEAVWDKLDLLRLTTGKSLENTGKHQAAIKEYATIREDGSYYDAAQKGIRRVWLAYQQESLRKQNVAQLLKQAEEHFLAKRYLRPVNKNAYTIYQTVLALEPHNRLALQKVDQMKDFYRDEGERYFEGKDWKRSLLYFEPYRFMDPDNSEINEKIAICRDKLARAEIARTQESESKGTHDQKKERVRRLLKDSGAESTTIMKYLFEEQSKGEKSEEPW